MRGFQAMVLDDGCANGLAIVLPDYLSGMREYERDIFYDMEDLSLETKTKILQDAFSIHTKWWVDLLDCNVSFARQRIEMSFEDIMARFSKASHFSVIHRRGYRHYGDVGFRTMGAGPDHFLWIITEVEDLVGLAERYELREL